MKSLKGLFAVLSAGTLALALPASAAPIPVSDQMILYRGGVVVDQRTIFEDQEPQGSPAFINSDTANPLAFGQATLLIDQNGQISDVFGVAFVNGHYGIGFLSDTDPGGVSLADIALYFGAATQSLTEKEGFAYSMTQYLNPAKIAQGYTATFASDVEARVPDAGTSMALLGLALAGLGFARRKLA